MQFSLKNVVQVDDIITRLVLDMYYMQFRAHSDISYPIVSGNEHVLLFLSKEHRPQ